MYGTLFAAKTTIVRYGTRKAAASYQSSETLEAAELSRWVVQLHGELVAAVQSLDEAKRAVVLASACVRDLNKVLTEAERALETSCDDAKASLLTAGGRAPLDLMPTVQHAESPLVGVVARRGGVEGDKDVDVDDTSISMAPDDDAES